MLYLENGFADIDYIYNRGMTFNFVIGGRGTGKTYGMLKKLITDNIRFCFMRRTQSQLDAISKPETSPFKAVLADMGVTWALDPVPAGKNIYAYYKTTFDEDHKPIYGDLQGYALALSTISNLRGFDMTDVECLVYDEFIPERHERAIKHESDAFFNAYETINRNRELRGQKPLKVMCLANSNDYAAPLLIGLKLVTTISKMIDQGKTEYINPQRSIGIYLLTDSPISTAKSQTALYKLTSQTSFAEMAINNAFEGMGDPDVHSVNLAEYAPAAGLGELTIYRHKSEGLYYISEHESGSVGHYSADSIDIKRFFASHRSVLMAAIYGKIIYENNLCKALFLKYCGLN